MTPEVVIVLQSGARIECTAKSAKYLIIGLGLEDVIKKADISTVPTVDCQPLLEAEPEKPVKSRGKSQKTA